MASYMFHGYQVVTHNPRHFHNVQAPMKQDTAEIRYAFKELPKILGIDKWVLTGGLTIPATSGEIKRRHEDIDIGVDVNDLEEVTRRVIDKNYGLFHRIFMNNSTKTEKLDIYHGITPAGAKVGRKKLRFVRVDERGKIVRHEHLLDYFDVYIYEKIGEQIHCIEDGRVSPLEWNVAKHYNVGEKLENDFAIRDLRFIKSLKQSLLERKSRKEKDTFDLREIEEILTHSQ